MREGDGQQEEDLETFEGEDGGQRFPEDEAGEEEAEEEEKSEQ